MSVINEFKQRFITEYTDRKIYSAKTSINIDFRIYNEREYMWINFKSGDFATAFLDDLGDFVLIKISMSPLGYRFQSREDDMLYICNKLSRNIKFGKVTLNDDFRFDIDLQYFASKSNYFESIINSLKKIADLVNDVIQFGEQYEGTNFILITTSNFAVKYCECILKNQ